MEGESPSPSMSTQSFSITKSTRTSLNSVWKHSKGEYHWGRIFIVTPPPLHHQQWFTRVARVTRVKRITRAKRITRVTRVTHWGNQFVVPPLAIVTSPPSLRWNFAPFQILQPHRWKGCSQTSQWLFFEFAQFLIVQSIRSCLLCIVKPCKTGTNDFWNWILLLTSNSPTIPARILQEKLNTECGWECAPDTRFYNVCHLLWVKVQIQIWENLGGGKSLWCIQLGELGAESCRIKTLVDNHEWMAIAASFEKV